MDALTHKTGITAQGRLIHGDQPEPTMAERHANRLRRACATMRPSLLRPKLRVRFHADGRRSFPGVVQYQLQDGGQLLDLPPTEEGVVYRRIVHDLAAYDRLQQTGALDMGHRLPLVGA